MEIWNNSLILSSGSWEDVDRATSSVQTTVINRLLEQRAVPVSLGLQYWTQVRTSGPVGLGLFYLQHGPQYAVRMAREPGFPRTALTALALPRWRPRVRPDGSLAQRAVSLVRFVVGQWRRLKAMFARPAQAYARAQRARLSAARDETAAQIGALLLASGPAPERIRCLARVVGLDAAALVLDTPEACLDALQAVLDQHAVSARAAVAVQAVPPAWVRWWPAAAAALAAAYYLNGSWQQLLDWFEGSVLGTLQAFWQNWLVDPLYQIYLTIRHDPNGQVALIAKESLTSDVASLVQMVVDFARDTNPDLTPADLNAIRLEAQNGNVTPVMAVYHRQLEAPLTNLITGKLIRTLLIQVQKSKVDAEVAISGIDQLLGSQQLVFGFLAALPALGIVSYLVRKLLSRRDNTAIVREDVLLRLGNVDEVVQGAAAQRSQLNELDLGLVYAELALIKRSAVKVRSIGRKQFVKSADRLLELAVKTQDIQAILGALDRIYMRFGFYT